MRFNVAGLLKGQTGDKREVTYSDHVSVALADAELVEPVRGRATLIREPLGILVDSKVSTTLSVHCSRCLKPAQHDLGFTVTESFVPTVPIPGGPAVHIDEDSDPANWINELHVLDLTEVLRQAIVLAVPINPLCRDDCRGLCPQCGRDLNDGPCECQPAPDPRWDDLRTLIHAGDS